MHRLGPPRMHRLGRPPPSSSVIPACLWVSGVPLRWFGTLLQARVFHYPVVTAALLLSISICISSICIYIYMSIYVNMYLYSNTICVLCILCIVCNLCIICVLCVACMSVCMSVCLYVCLHICMYVCN